MGDLFNGIGKTVGEIIHGVDDPMYPLCDGGALV